MRFGFAELVTCLGGSESADRLCSIWSLILQEASLVFFTWRLQKSISEERHARPHGSDTRKDYHITSDSFWPKQVTRAAQNQSVRKKSHFLRKRPAKSLCKQHGYQAV